ncbi:hypothetical protein SARC_08193 [Sphaeroforma arctica JP610]|uniref:Uncharacterized protein n=1 Tax=Sphaeroforma arctica JP610 TaxID=667725 RepID=A0A0L0FS35_9EUKA|nr:hypothetical protein SARC_08193 [Sphaeroforma arctica JP610]KNC79411.1 hypothetical protein SARC_08193 [Sphaeroforma arctica JP610]|eukprot:XP_014153313.1 hypothetical protein SARC_08193 [Sphaeroforma arctica JP610]
MPCPVLSCPVLSCPVLSCPVLSCPGHSGHQSFACVSLKDLMIVSLGELGALFVVHSSAVVDMQTKFGTCATTLGESLLIVNVTSNLAQPLHTFVRHDTHMSSRWHSSIVGVLKHFTEQLTAAVEVSQEKRGCECGTCDRAVHPGDICDSATVDTFAGEGSTVTITYPHTINLSTLYGFILDYPCLYWYDHVLSTANCLSMTPLRLYDCEFSAPSPSETGPGAWFRTAPYRFTSFSIPGCIADSLAETWEERMGHWTTQLQTSQNKRPAERVLPRVPYEPKPDWF